MRSMPLAFPEDPKWDKAMAQYMLGDAFLVTAFADELMLPQGLWLDFWTKKTIQGPATMKASFPANRGGYLLMKQGAIVPTWPVKQCIATGVSAELGFYILPGPDKTSFTLYEDDGISLEYQNGRFATTMITCAPDSTIVIAPTEGSFNGLPDAREITIEILAAGKASNVYINNVPADTWKNTDTSIVIYFTEKSNETATLTWK